MLTDRWALFGAAPALICFSLTRPASFSVSTNRGPVWAAGSQSGRRQSKTTSVFCPVNWKSHVDNNNMFGRMQPVIRWDNRHFEILQDTSVCRCLFQCDKLLNLHVKRILRPEIQPCATSVTRKPSDITILLQARTHEEDYLLFISNDYFIYVFLWWGKCW